MIPKESLNILLADDDVDDRHFFDKALKDISIIPTNLKTVTNGEQLMDYLLKNTTNLPDILFLDINMPHRNGSECLRSIKHNEVLKHIPIIMSSTSLSDYSVNELYQAGVHYYLHKCDFTELKGCIRKILTLLTQPPFQQPSRKHFKIN